MPLFNLNIEPCLQGGFKLKKINLAFVFQVNCPGCFEYGFPLVNELYLKYANNFGFIGISTAFEDFEFNTELHTKQLLNDGTIIGETKKYFSKKFGIEKYNQKVHFPIAIDKTKTPEQFLTTENLSLICESNPNYKIWPQWEKDLMHEKVKSYYDNFPLISVTFTLNQLRGTPSFIIFDDKKIIVESFFGYQDIENLQSKLIQHLNQKS